MSRVKFSVSMTSDCDRQLRKHLLRFDGQEDLCFAIWHPSQGATRMTAVVRVPILPVAGDRNVHGNASFNPAYLERALSAAAAAGGGLALLHSHPSSQGWQGMSPDDVNAENGRAAAVLGATGFPLVGLTLAGDRTWSARFWPKVAPRTYQREFCGSVRVVGDNMVSHFFDDLAPRPRVTGRQIRTVSSWGPRRQENLTRLRVGVVGAGSVGGLIAEGLARTGFEDVSLIDFDHIEDHNLDRLVYATPDDIGHVKVDVLAERLKRSTTAGNFRAVPFNTSVYQEAGFRAALDCDILFSCVDRPWGRHVLNLIAYAHLIPVYDGGIAVKVSSRGELQRADWKAHTCAPGRPCLACLGQYSTGLVQAEREGMLDDPTYIAGLPDDHPLKSRQNVFAFSMSCASFQMMQMLGHVISPLGLTGPNPQLYHFVGSFLEMDAKPPEACQDHCLFAEMVGMGDHAGFDILAQHDDPVAGHEAELAGSSNTPQQSPSWISRIIGFFKGQLKWGRSAE